jgi:hypothetical protein
MVPVFSVGSFREGGGFDRLERLQHIVLGRVVLVEHLTARLENVDGITIVPTHLLERFFHCGHVRVKMLLDGAAGRNR